MVKIASQIKQQKPGKNRGKNCNAICFIRAAKEASDKSKQLLVDIQALIQGTNMGKSPQHTRKQDSRDLLKASMVASSTEAEKANKGQKFRSKSVNKTGKVSLHPGQDRLGDLLQKNKRVRRFVTTNLTKRQECHNKVRAGRRKPGARAELPIHSLHGQRGSERSVGWSVALWPCGPDARPQTR
jgi:hypothetical protein